MELFEDNYLEKFYLPKEFIGNEMTGNKYITGIPRKWTKEEEDWLIMLKNKGFSNKQIAEFLYRNIVQVSIKNKRLNKSEGKKYNQRHRQDKYFTNNEFFNIINPKSILDLYSGENSFYFNKTNKLITNDINKSFNCTYNEDAVKLLCKLYYENQKFDLIDIDPFGSPYECLDLSIKMANKALIVTLGEMGHKRFKRLDFVRSHYNIQSLEDFTSEKISNEIVKIGIRNKKKLIPIYIKNWIGISRIYYKIENLKITETWDNIKPIK